MTFLEQQFGLAGQVAVVFGGGSGIGRRSALFLAQAGAAVCLVDLDPDSAQAAAADMVSSGIKAASAGCDVRDEAQVRAAIEHAEATLGPVSIVVDSAGIFPSALLDDQTVESWDFIQAVNLRGAFLCVREGARAIRRCGTGGRIIMISSTTSLTPGVPSLAAYSSAKAGVNALVRTAAMEYAADAITVNAILPGDTLTEGAMKATMAPSGLAAASTRGDRRPIKRLGDPSDVAQAVLAFAAPGAAYVTGQTLVVDGGQLTS
jgi:NAD(P)-dependent dehydrogenase (short-subunit alcohol dehydrogenase family)